MLAVPYVEENIIATTDPVEEIDPNEENYLAILAGVQANAKTKREKNKDI